MHSLPLGKLDRNISSYKQSVCSRDQKMEYKHSSFKKPFEAGKYIDVTGEMVKDVSANGLCGPGIL
jgi:hypothetical protein